MKRKMQAVAFLSAASLTLAGCGGGSSDNGSGGGGAEANAAIDKIARPSTAKGGTVRYAVTEDWDSVDPADTYYAMSWDFLRNYVRPLVTFKATPGKGALAPDLAKSLGKSSNGGKTWTYTLRDGVKFEDGTPITSKDVKYAVARSLDKDTFPNGPTYFNDWLAGVPKGYSVYKNKNLDALKSIQTPNSKTIVFNLKAPFAGFDYFAALPATAPVPQAKDTGTKYRNHVVSSGPYKFSLYQAKKRYELTRNENYDPKTDPDSGRAALSDKVTVDLNVNAADLDQQLMAGTLDVDMAGNGVLPQTQAKILADPNLKKNTDLAPTTRTWFSVMPADVPAVSNLDCRKAVMYAYSSEGYQRAYGGSTGGDAATSMLPPTVPGHTDIDPYGKKAQPKGDVAKAKEALAKCGKPNGFSTNIAFRSDRPKEKAVAESLQQSLRQVGIKTTLKGYPSGDYFKLYAGKPDYVKKNNLGILVYGWSADWPDGYGFFEQIVDSRVIRAAGNTNLGIKVPAVDKLIDKALVTSDEDARNKLWGDVDKAVMDNASVIPGVWAKAFLYRPEHLTNMMVSGGYDGMYDYTAIGTTKK